ncbi:hypothetical protein [Halorubrum lacusprofundi]|uniref:hypothetical protein n=1 Tax=Halorubrum lacusprofundi TaxID=2247 RepID=UPI001F5B5EAF|nr:hypothetical protein [Halorubrum lacusprofundi]
MGESGRLKIDRDDTLSDGSARDSATRRSRPRVETRPIDAGRASLETEPDDRVPRCGREAPPFTAGEDVTVRRCLVEVPVKAKFFTVITGQRHICTFYGIKEFTHQLVSGPDVRIVCIND